jgi:hypothetical protein
MHHRQANLADHAWQQQPQIVQGILLSTEPGTSSQQKFIVRAVGLLSSSSPLSSASSIIVIVHIIVIICIIIIYTIGIIISISSIGPTNRQT